MLTCRRYSNGEELSTHTQKSLNHSLRIFVCCVVVYWEEHTVVKKKKTFCLMLPTVINDSKWIAASNLQSWAQIS